MSSAPGTPDTPPITGLLVIDKPLGLTSMAVCRKVRGRLVAGGAPKRVKVGHGGTLDPLATGVLVILVGRATRLCEQVMHGAKAYRATIDLAHTSPTDDLESEPIPTEITTQPTEADIVRTLEAFTGTIDQHPPAHSAVKVDGQRAYTRARAGDEERPPARPVRIDALRIVHYEWPELILDIDCGRGVYIRSLARDLGTALNTGGMLTALRRTRVGEFTDLDAIQLDDLPSPLDPHTLPVPPVLRDALDRPRRADQSLGSGSGDSPASDAG